VVIDPYLSDNLNTLSNGFWLVAYLSRCRSPISSTSPASSAPTSDQLDPVTVAAILTASADTVPVALAAVSPTLPWRMDLGRLRGMRGERDTYAIGPSTVRSLPAARCPRCGLFA